MDLYKLIKKQEKKSASEILVKTIIVVGAVAAIALLVAALYKKWRKCTTISPDTEFEDEWFCDCNANDTSCCCDDENVCCPGGQAEGNCEDKEI